MKRDLLNNLELWKSSPTRKPLIIRGARQVGKSWLVKEFSKKFPILIELNFEENPNYIELFEGNLDPKEILPLISNFTGTPIVAGQCLLFLDEIQLCPRAITALRFFYEKIPALHVIAAGSLLEFELQKLSIPVGRIQFLYLKPLSFAEFLVAMGKENLRKHLLEHPQKNKKIANPLHKQLLNLVREYCFIGGMPEVVKTYRQEKSLEKCQNIQSQILNTYRIDFAKYARKNQIKHVRVIFDNLIYQLGRKFKYANTSTQYKSRELAPALELLEMAGLTYKIYHSHGNGIPLGAEIDLKKFKTLFFDIGLANRMLGLNLKDYLLIEDIQEIHQGQLAELFVGLELKAYLEIESEQEIYYWHRESKSSNAEIDYLFSQAEQIIPIEVKSGQTGSLRSLNLFMKEKESKTGFRFSANQHESQGNIETLPFYSIEAWIKDLNRQ